MMHFLESKLLGRVLGEELRAAAFVLWCRRFEPSPDFDAISAETGISLDVLRKAWDIARAEEIKSKSDCEVV